MKLNQEKCLFGSASRTRVIIISPYKLIGIQSALKFKFETTNDKAEYEVIITTLKLASKLKLEHTRVFRDSQLMVG